MKPLTPAVERLLEEAGELVIGGRLYTRKDLGGQKVPAIRLKARRVKSGKGENRG